MSLFKKKEKKVPTCACCNSESQPETPTPVCSCNVGNIESVIVLGAGCPSCHTLYENAQKAVKDMGLNLTVEYITDLQKVMSYGVMSVPALVVNKKVVSTGKVLKPNDIVTMLGKLK